VETTTACTPFFFSFPRGLFIRWRGGDWVVKKVVFVSRLVAFSQIGTFFDSGFSPPPLFAFIIGHLIFQGWPLFFFLFFEDVFFPFHLYCLLSPPLSQRVVWYWLSFSRVGIFGFLFIFPREF